jgi:hypothetical protein
MKFIFTIIIISELSNYYFFSGGVYPETKNEALRGVYPAVGGTQDDQRRAQDGRKRRAG